MPKRIFIFSAMDHRGSSHLTSKRKLVIKFVVLHNAKRYVDRRNMMYECLHSNASCFFYLYNTCIIQIDKIDNITIYAYEFSAARAPEMCESLSNSGQYKFAWHVSTYSHNIHYINLFTFSRLLLFHHQSGQCLFQVLHLILLLLNTHACVYVLYDFFL